MPAIETTRLRNVALLSHSGAGKTVIAESMLFATGAITRQGSVQEGTTASDYEPEEQRREASVQTAIVQCMWRDHKINLLDTPGYADFRGEVISAIRVAEAAVIVVAAPSGVEVGTQQMWRMADERGLPRLLFVNKLDRENTDFLRVLDSISETFGRKCVAVQVAVGSETDFSAVVSLLDPKAEAPAGMEDQVEEARERLIEAVAEADDDLATKYLEGEEITSDEMIAGLRQGVATGDIVPVMAGAATIGVGTKELMDAIVDLLPSPAQSAAVTATDADGQEVQLDGKADGPLAALVFKTSADPFVGKLSYFRVYSGTFKSDTQITNATRDESERVGHLFTMTGKDQEPVAELAPGDVGAVPKLASALTGDTLTDRGKALLLPRLEFGASVYRMAVYPASKADLDKLTTALARICEEDPSLQLTRDPGTNEMLLGGLGDVHVDVAVEKMKRKFGVEVLLEIPRVAYRETISIPTKVEYRHKKQSGGHGQFGHVWLEIQPLERGAGFEFDVKVVGGSVPREYIPSVQKGCRQAIEDGVLAGYPVVDLKATLVDGKFHPVDSSGVSFEIAGSHALSDGIRQANPTLLEPVMLARITVPESDTGDIMGDLNGKRARILGMLPNDDGTTTVEAEVPQAEMLRYATDLRSQTQGRGTFTIEFDHYDEVPVHLIPRVVEQTQTQEKERAEARA
jgi:elongation factor G